MSKLMMPKQMVEEHSFLRAMNDLEDCAVPVVDTETTGLRPYNGDSITGIAVKGNDAAYYFPFGHVSGNLPIRYKGHLIELLSKKKKHRGYNYKFDLHFEGKDGLVIPDEIEDPIFGIHLLNENEPSLKLKRLGAKYVDPEADKDEQILIDKLLAIGAKKDQMWKLPAEDVAPYACTDVILPDQLLELITPYLKDNGLYDIFRQINEYSLITMQMEKDGLRIDTDLMKRYEVDAEAHMRDLESKIHSMVGYSLNLNSSKQLQKLLGMKSVKRELLDRRLDKEPNNELLQLIMLYKQWSGVKSKYYSNYWEYLDDDGFLHPNYNLTGTVAGRPSCSKPNLQAVAKSNEIFRVKDVFVSREGHTLVSADYSQAELRLASYYGEPHMRDIINSGADIHSSTADTLCVDRDIAKRINFGIVYGIGAPGLSDKLNIGMQEARGYLRQYHGQFPGFKALYHKCESVANDKGYITMWTGRKRHYEEGIPTHKALSNLIQGGVAEIMRVTITRLYRELHEYSIKLLLQVYDQVLFDIPDPILYESMDAIKSVMEDLPFNPRMIVEIKYGKSWGNMQVYKKEA